MPQYNQLMVNPSIIILFLVVLSAVANQSPKCDQNCLDCADGKCNKCKQLSYPSGNTCKACGDKCIECSSSTNCTACIFLHYSNDGICQRCPSSCTSCNNINNCTVCASSYHLSEGECKACIRGCFSCTNATNCLTCANNFYSKDSTCLACHEFCAECQNYVGCKSCRQGYYLETQTCKSCQDKCAVCSNSQTCKTCIPGFYFLNNICLSCNSCSEKAKCIKDNTCPSASSLSSQKPEASESGFTIAIYVITPIALGVFLLGCCAYVAMKGRGRGVHGKLGDPHTDKTATTNKNLQEEEGMQSAYPGKLKTARKPSEIDLDYDGDAIHSTDTI